jgi:hypothetical protein
MVSVSVTTPSAESQNHPEQPQHRKYTDHRLHQNLRYKDYQLASRAAAVQRENAPDPQQMKRTTGLFESETVRDFGNQMQQRGVYAWWRQGMGFTGSEDRL